jgi:putative tricarboxylic transport membrane protein
MPVRLRVIHNERFGAALLSTSNTHHQSTPMSLDRRQFLIRATALATLGTASATALHAQSAGVSARPRSDAAIKLGERLRIVIPGNPGGGWDQTGRALGASLVACGATDQVIYENVGGQGGTLGLARFVETYSADANALLINGMVMVGAIALNKPAIGLNRVQPLARLTSDNLLVVVPATSSIRTTSDLMVALKKSDQQLTFAGGSAGGVDHMFAGVLMRAAKVDPRDLAYLPFASGPEVTTALMQGRANVGISGYSEFRDAIVKGTVRVVGMAGRRSQHGVPTFKDEGVDSDITNWRAVYAGSQIAPARMAQMLAAVEHATHHETWTRTLRQYRWDASLLAGKDMQDFVAFEEATAKLMVQLLKLKT